MSSTFFFLPFFFSHVFRFVRNNGNGNCKTNNGRDNNFNLVIIYFVSFFFGSLKWDFFSIPYDCVKIRKKIHLYVFYLFLLLYINDNQSFINSINEFNFDIALL